MKRLVGLPALAVIVGMVGAPLGGIFGAPLGGDALAQGPDGHWNGRSGRDNGPPPGWDNSPDGPGWNDRPGGPGWDNDRPGWDNGPRPGWDNGPRPGYGDGRPGPGYGNGPGRPRPDGYSLGPYSARPYAPGPAYSYTPPPPRYYGPRPGYPVVIVRPPPPVYFYNEDRRAVRDYFRWRSPPPPVGVSIVVGQPFPYGVAYAPAPYDLYPRLHEYPGAELRIVGRSAVLVAVDSGFVLDILHDIFD
ncbi:hypothetical protein [Rhodospirillum rubrum]|uniref:Uncharacterized protein n=1 Tax=Rhodospirillum rubrum (strain ATCC 11170 / ATH 1.1.1 / DSM 467 / LMG 4362 / NCIMB 8255 / S1) TaxID=269796 RepID=Q2RSG3_RHORT|nr:hypothetical protein [Rhodospirillum rubrum]ABC22932.1 hypothetical protein Rru_A2132 [Rhodospirillum rubrum ATCC 11170]MBK5954553.1 hypothetical protein [Rhodospirillum rubrum]QXG78919.1 hypothetical protein KUL73_11030 [Rhodospirillum rubrum]HCF17623.1 hypothetical protein [Rhodospirillum rubrum]